MRGLRNLFMLHIQQQKLHILLYIMLPKTIFRLCRHLCELLLWVGEDRALRVWRSQVLIPARSVCVLMKRTGDPCSLMPGSVLIPADGRRAVLS